MVEKPLICIDFDGVLCDSVLECFVSSWVGFFHLYRKERPMSVSLEEMETFRSYRPYIRSGEDFIILQECIFKRIPLTNQDDFDRVRGALTDKTIQMYRDYFYSARTELLEEDRITWLRLNPLFPQISKFVDRIAASDQSHIISTKKVQFIAKVLQASGISWPSERIHCSGDEQKPAFIKKVMEKTDYNRALFFDDQIDHFKSNNREYYTVITGYLPVWGYVKSEWLTREALDPLGVKAIDADEFYELMTQYCSGF
jgi:phosphoglycolate phosphatase-like HAD superfamily hydrolase